MSFVLWFIPSGSLNAQQRTPAAGGNQWEVLEGCRLKDGKTSDGDSFHVEHQGREYIFRLYFVDAPEANHAFPDRVQDQAAFFGISTNLVLELGAEAAQFSTERLQGTFTIITRWQNALGRSTLARFYGVVLKDGQNLAALLVEHGLARIHGLRANWPDGPRSSLFVSQLRNLELNAKERRVGAWNTARFARITQPSRNASPDSAEPRLELNEATLAQLEQLPGIGKVLAERIVAHRPYRDVEELKKVRGIGDKTFEQLKPRLHVTPVSDQTRTGK